MITTATWETMCPWIRQSPLAFGNLVVRSHFRTRILRNELWNTLGKFGKKMNQNLKKIMSLNLNCWGFKIRTWMAMEKYWSYFQASAFRLRLPLYFGLCSCFPVEWPDDAYLNLINLSCNVLTIHRYSSVTKSHYFLQDLKINFVYSRME